MLRLSNGGQFVGHYHLYIGQEATGVAVMAALDAARQARHHAPQPRPRAGARRRSRPRHGRDPRPRHRPQRRPRRHHSSDRAGPRLHLDVGHRRRLHLARRRRRLCVPPTPRRLGRGAVLRRRRARGRRELRGAQHRVAVAPAGRVHVREQQHRLVGAGRGLPDARSRQQRSVQHRAVARHRDGADRRRRCGGRLRGRLRCGRALPRRRGPGLRRGDDQALAGQQSAVARAGDGHNRHPHGDRRDRAPDGEHRDWLDHHDPVLRLGRSLARGGRDAAAPHARARCRDARAHRSRR